LHGTKKEEGKLDKEERKQRTQKQNQKTREKNVLSKHDVKPE